jgi:hypothetical protein
MKTTYCNEHDGSSSQQENKASSLIFIKKVNLFELSMG